MRYVYKDEGYFGADKEKGVENHEVVLKKDDGDSFEVFAKDKRI